MNKNDLILYLSQDGISVEDKVKYFRQLYNKVSKEVGIRNESYFRDKLADELNGDVEVEVINGYVDIITDDEIIEVKRMKRWKQAIGQIMVYGLHLDNYKKRIHLIDDLSNYNRWLIEDACRELDIKVTFEKDPVLERVYDYLGDVVNNIVNKSEVEIISDII